MHHLHLAAVDCLEFFSKRMQWIIVVVLWVILGIAPASWADTIRVDPNSPTDGDGSSWSLAKHSLASVMSSANSGDFILVADATYKPANQASSFLLHSGVSVLGGYAGYGAGNPDARNLDPATNGCVMSGDISGNDGANFTNYSDNCYHVLKTDSNISNSTVIESVTIRGGNASGSNDEDSGGGMFIVSGRPKVRYCRIIENRADNYGGGVWFKNAGTSDDNAIFRDCVISSNYAVHLGGGMYLIPAVHLVNSRLEDNAAGDTGGAVYVGASEDVNIYNCVLAGNTSQGGSAAYCTGGGLTRFANTLMHSNSSSAYGGAVMIGSSTEIIIADSTIADNTAVNGGGAV